MNFGDRITLNRACEAIQIPSGMSSSLPAGTAVRIMQSRGNSYTVATDFGEMFRVDLGLIYSCEIAPTDEGGKKIDIKMSMTAPGCGMGNVLKADVESKLAALPEVKEVHVDVVFDPPWNPTRMSEAARLQLGFDL